MVQGLDFAVLAVGFAKEDGGGRVTVGYGGDVHAYIISINYVICQAQNYTLHAYKFGTKTI